MAGPECISLKKGVELCVEINGAIGDDDPSSNVFLRSKGQTEEIIKFRGPFNTDMMCTPEKSAKIVPTFSFNHAGDTVHNYTVMFGTRYQDDNGCHVIKTDSLDISTKRIDRDVVQLQKKIADRQDFFKSFASQYDAYIQRANEPLAQLMSCKNAQDCIISSARVFCDSKFVDAIKEDPMGNEYRPPNDESTKQRVHECVDTISLAAGCELKEAMQSTKSYRKDAQGLQTYLRTACSGDKVEK